MKTKLEMAHEYAMLHMMNAQYKDVDDLEMVQWAFDYADAMQAEADKRAKKCDEKIEINMYPEYDATINYPPDAWVMYRGEKRLAVSIKEDWQPDWSVAPEWVKYWAIDKDFIANWFDGKPSMDSGYLSFGESIQCDVAPSFNYKGDWRESLRKRPQ